MSKEIFLYSKNKKYKCAVELADSRDHFGCPDNSVMILFEERKDGTYIIAQARDKRLETEKDRIITDLELKLAEKDQELNDICQNYDFQLNDFSREIYRLQQREKLLQQQLSESEIRRKESEIFYKREINRRDTKLRNIKQELKKKETRIAELKDKDWYEALIKQLEEQNGRLIKERDNAKLQLTLTEKALKLAREYMLNVMCADDVPSVEWFIKSAKEMMKSE